MKILIINVRATQGTCISTTKNIWPEILPTPFNSKNITKMYLISFFYTVQMKMKNNIYCKHRVGNNPTMSIKLTVYGKMLVNLVYISFYNHFSWNTISGKASYVYERFFQKRTFIIVVLATWALWKYKSMLKKVLVLNSEIKQKKNKATRWEELYDLVSVKCMKWPDPLHIKLIHLVLCWWSSEWSIVLNRSQKQCTEKDGSKLHGAHLKRSKRVTGLNVTLCKVRRKSE